MNLIPPWYLLDDWSVQTDLTQGRVKKINGG